MKYEGFFTRAEATGKLPTRASFKSKQSVSAEQLHRLGLNGVTHLNPDAEHPNIQPTGAEHPDVYVMGEAPGVQEDKKGRPFVGPSGRLVREHLEGLRVRFDNVCRTRPPGNRDPEWQEIECFRPTVQKSVEYAKPRVLLAMGALALSWAMPGHVGGIRLARGRRFPWWVGAHPCWVVPVLHPTHILRLAADERSMDGKIPGTEVIKAWENDLRGVREDSAEWPDAKPVDRATLFDKVECLTKPTDIIAALKRFENAKCLAVDLETTTLRPYEPDALILSVALCDGEQTIAFPLGHSHDEIYPNKTVEARVIAALKLVLSSAKYIVPHNLNFEAEWFFYYFGFELFARVAWQDTMGEGFILDERTGALSLDYLCRQHLGLPLKSLSPVSAKKMNLISEPLMEVLKYNALDAKYTHALHRKQWPMIHRDGLLDIYAAQVRRVPTLVLTQMQGLCVDQKKVVEFETRYAKEMRIAQKIARRLPEVEEFERTKPFNIASPHDIRRVFRGLLKKDQSTDKEALDGLDHPLAKAVLQYRRVAKLHGTYIVKLRPDAKDSYIYPDGRVHTSFNSTVAETGRTTSNDPNLQNVPKRGEGKEVRACFVAPPNESFLSEDYKQLEAWVIAMASEDERFVDALRTGYDVHMYWAEKIANAYPKVMKRPDIQGDIKKFRSAVKNEWTFPLFFGSSYRSCAAQIGIPEELAKELADEFWSDFRGVKRWQKRTMQFYSDNGYVEGLTGRRRRAPLKYNQVINTPIQGAASDIVVNAMCRLSEMARTGEGPKWMQPILNIHDDLTFYVPTKEVPVAAKRIAAVMTDVSAYGWAVLPLTVEAESGTNWADMKPVGTFKGKG